MDCIFKTNRFRLPLFNIVGCTLLHTTFFLAFALTNSRAKEAFIWIFERLCEIYTELELDFPRTLAIDNEKGIITPIREVFPEAVYFFCIGYVQKNVIAWTRKKFVKQENLNRNTSLEKISAVMERRLNEFKGYWNAVIYSSTEITFDKAWDALNIKYVKPFSAVILYFEDTGLRHYKEKFCRPWTQ